MPFHPKVIAAAIGAAIPSLILAILTWAQDNPDTLGSHVPKPLAGLLILLIPPLAAAVAGYIKSGGAAGLAVDGAAAERLAPPHAPGARVTGNVRRTDDDLGER